MHPSAAPRRAANPAKSRAMLPSLSTSMGIVGLLVTRSRRLSSRPALSRRRGSVVPRRQSESLRSSVAGTDWTTEEGVDEERRETGASTSSLSSFSSSSDDDDASPPPRRRPPSSSPSLEAESLRMLEWPSVCRQVACLTQTPMGARRALFSESDKRRKRRGGGAKDAASPANGNGRGGIPLASTREEAERLLDETEAALRALERALPPFDLSGALDLTPLLDSLRVAGGGGESDGGRDPETSPSTNVTPLAVSGVADTLEAAASAAEAAAPFPALASLSRGRLTSERLSSLLKRLREAVPRGEGPRIVDSFTTELAEARAARRDADAAARNSAAEWSKRLHAAGASARTAVAMRRERLCVPVLTARKSELPRGSVTLATSASGATSFCEPAPLVPLNNAAAEARGAEEAAERAALAELTELVVARGRELRGVVEAVSELDVARARAQHARWVSGGETKESLASTSTSSSSDRRHPTTALRPRLVDARSAREDPGGVRIEGLVHPLLLEGALRRLPNPPGVEDEGGDGDGGGESAAAAPAGSPALPFPRGLDFLVPPRTSVVVVSGPNTGGKTAGLKSLGLASLMSRAGLFLAVEKKATGESPPAPPPPTLAFFDSVLADVGDPQSLSASLSTFSGHVKRAARALEAVGGGSGGGDSSPPPSSSALVLLDELGAGTDPSEGAALGAALLDAFAESPGAALTVATAHFAELRGDGRPHVADAAVEFDPSRLAPTYRLLWGSGPGASCALEVARGLGFDAEVVDAAAAALGRGDGVGLGGGIHDDQEKNKSSASSTVSRTRADVLAAAAGLASTIAADLAAARRDAESAARERAEAERALAEASAAVSAAERAEREAAEARARAAASAESDVAWALEAFERGELSEDEASDALEEVGASAPDPAEAAARLARARTRESTVDDDDDVASPSSPSTSVAWLPDVGETVSVLKMGGQIAVVTRAPRSPGGPLSVRLRGGKGLDVTLRTFEVAPPPREGESGSGNGTSSTSLRGAARSGSLSFAPPAAARKSPEAPAIKTPANTVDVRGLDPASAAATVRDAVGSADDGDALFVVHGLGTGAVKKAVRAELASMEAKAKKKKGEKKGRGFVVGGGVAYFKDDEESGGGVTIVRVRR